MLERLITACVEWLSKPLPATIGSVLTVLAGIAAEAGYYPDQVMRWLTVIGVVLIFAVFVSGRRDTLGIQKKLDGLVRASDADDALACIEKRTAEEIEALA